MAFCLFQQPNKQLAKAYNVILSVIFHILLCVNPLGIIQVL